ncbi:MAG: aconitase X swivel domain-containing protein [Actinomycetota bacterium]
MSPSGRDFDARVLVEGEAEDEALVLAEPLSFWGGLDPKSGRIIDRHHPQAGEVVSGRVLVMPSGRGSSTASTVLAEAIRAGTAPAGIVLAETDPIITVGALVAHELYGRWCPVVVLSGDAFGSIATGDAVTIDATGRDPARVYVTAAS